MIRSIPVCLITLFISEEIYATEFARPYMYIFKYDASNPEYVDKQL